MPVIASSLTEISKEQADAMPMADAWKDGSIAPQQYDLTKKELDEWFSGKSIAPFDVMKECLFGLSGSLLEVGCGVGHYATAMDGIGFFNYTGIDYSDTAIALARQRRIRDKFYVMDACLLNFADRSFDIVISGCVLLHIVDWRRALKEAARVANSYLILHRTPVSDEPTRYFHKKAYGVDVVEIHFNKAEMISETESHGFTLRKTFPVTKGQETLLFERGLMYHPV